MLHYALLFIFFITSTALWAQDERYYRKMLAGDLSKEMKMPDGLRKFFVAGDAYLLDLNGDGIEERIIPQKRDGVDWIEIQDSSQNTLFSSKLFATGSNGHLFRIRKVKINSTVTALILFLDEGLTHGGRIESQGRIFLISYEKNDLSTMKLQEGARFFHEMKAPREQYYRRAYKVNVYDIDKDGEREIVIEYRHIQRIFKYAGLGRWRIY